MSPSNCLSPWRTQLTKLIRWATPAWGEEAKGRCGGESKPWGKKVNCVKGSDVKIPPFYNESKQRRFSGFLEPLMSVFLASFAKYFWKRQPQIWFLVALKLMCQPDIAFIAYAVYAVFVFVKNTWSPSSSRRAGEGWSLLMLLWWRSSRTRPTSSTLLERFSKKQIWVNSAIKISQRCRFEDLCNRFSCTQLMLTTFARSSGHFLKSKRLEG